MWIINAFSQTSIRGATFCTVVLLAILHSRIKPPRRRGVMTSAPWTKFPVASLSLCFLKFKVWGGGVSNTFKVV